MTFLKSGDPQGAEYDGVLTVNPRGFGFVSSVGLADDLYVAREALRGALHGDVVRVRALARSRRGLEGEVVRVVTRRNARVAGLLRRRGKSAWLEPDDTRVRGPIVLAPRDGAPIPGEDGEACVVTITRFPELPEENPEGVVEAVLGPPGDPNVEVAKVLLRESIEEAHPPEAISEAEAFGREVTPDALIGREDLTHLPLPTIDPEDARDHDDAVWAIREADGSYKVWIAIADVSHYVRPGTALAASALARGNSIYLPDRAIPMLPRALSSNLCSLLPNVVRLCMCVEIELDAAAVVTRARVIEGYMRSAAKLTYPGVARALGFTNLPPRSPEAEELRGDLMVLWDLARLLRTKRMRRGALDFDLPEPHVVLDAETGVPISVQRRAHDPGVKKAYQLIEELMLLANETVASLLTKQAVPTVFRNHARPDEAKLARFATMCDELGIKFDLEDAADPKRLSVFLRKLGSHPQHDVLNMLLLRAMKQAAYDVENIGHFGLASSAYLHFTSPIRRYPDVLVHRATRALLRGDAIDRTGPAIETMRASAVTASMCERRGMEVEREIIDLYRALYMRQHIGSSYEGTVTALVSTGVFVAVAEPFVDVLVRMESLGSDAYDLDEQGLRLVAARSGERIAIGDKMRVQIEDVAILRRTVYARRLADKASDDKPKKRKKLRTETTAGRAAKGKAKDKARGAPKTPKRKKR
jgi:ribonuclease R